MPRTAQAPTRLCLDASPRYVLPPASYRSRLPPAFWWVSEKARSSGIGALAEIAQVARDFGHIQEVIVQNFMPKPGTAMAKSEPCPQDDYLRAIALARLILPALVHIQAPPNLSEDFGRLSSGRSRPLGRCLAHHRRSREPRAPMAAFGHVGRGH